MTRAAQRPGLYRDYRFPGEVIVHAVWLYLRFPSSFRDVEEMLAERDLRPTLATRLSVAQTPFEA